MGRIKNVVRKFLGLKTWTEQDKSLFTYALPYGKWYKISDIVQFFVENDIGDIGKMEKQAARKYFVDGLANAKGFSVGVLEDGTYCVKNMNEEGKEGIANGC